jgi:hypothetical protein
VWLSRCPVMLVGRRTHAAAGADGDGVGDGDGAAWRDLVAEVVEVEAGGRVGDLDRDASRVLEVEDVTVRAGVNSRVDVAVEVEVDVGVEGTVRDTEGVPLTAEE